MGSEKDGTASPGMAQQVKPSWGTRILNGAASGLSSPFGSRKNSSAQRLSLMDKDAPRHPLALPTGGMGCDQQQLAEQRGLAMVVVKQIGMNVLRGKDLLYVTFPMSTAEPRTALQKFALSCSLAPDLLQKAADTSDPVARIKLVMAFYVAGMSMTSGIKKPLNPLLGETLEAQLDHQTMLYMEQTSHHPPVSSWVLRGRGYQYYGYMNYEARFGLNEVKLMHSGGRRIDFADGSSVSFTNPWDSFSGVLFGTYTHNTYGSVLFSDEKNHISCELKFGDSKNELSDFFSGTICRDADTPQDEQLGIVTGSWLSYFDCDGERVWTINKHHMYTAHPLSNILPSDSSRRPDLMLFLDGKLEEAADAKIALEERQRNDRKLRQAASTSSGIHGSASSNSLRKDDG
ncbi:Oxysterol-binding protein 9 [Porphyridium purpureum]|uniref:Oxysterol-binding protein 9 n=1 Tax=Porphyridium purpureum TaxID=35688 RepID=A0A5J4YYL1_PORPP|nr:Oxysterol-binding protein 9 [Porphyridium purpureum]|eukprot:POR4474..scf208_2